MREVDRDGGPSPLPKEPEAQAYTDGASSGSRGEKNQKLLPAPSDKQRAK